MSIQKRRGLLDTTAGDASPWSILARFNGRRKTITFDACFLTEEEWHFDSITVDSQTKKFSRRKNIIESLDGDLPKKNAGYLLKLGVSEEVLFGSFFEASTEILELIQSLDSKDLEENCKNWLVALNKYVEKELWKLI